MRVPIMGHILRVVNDGKRGERRLVDLPQNYYVIPAKAGTHSANGHPRPALELFMR
jgi:hypothetical protein